MATALPRRIVGILSTLLLALTTVTALSTPAHAEDGYQYWNYFHLENGAWAFSQVGPAEYQPADGTVEAFRFGTSTTSQGIEPRADLADVSFDSVCEGKEAGDGEKRVALLLDFGVDEGQGTPPDPRAECAVVADAATTQQVLEQVAEVRVEGGMTCALDGYPAAGCGTPVKNAEIPASEEPVSFVLPGGTDAADPDDMAAATDATSEDEGGSTPWLLGGAAVLVALIAGGGLLMARRNRA